MAELSSDVAAVRKRPAMYVGDTGTFGLSHLVYFLLDAAVEEARGGTLRQLSLCLGEDGSVEVVDDGRPVPPEALPELLTRLRPDLAIAAYEPLRFETLCVFALSEHFELEAWDDGRSWRLRGESGVIRELPSPAPLPSLQPSGPRGTRVRFRPDRTLFAPEATLDARRLHLRCRELAGLTPGLAIHFRSARLQDWSQYPRGLSDLVDELTQAQLPCMDTPLVAEAPWEDLRVRLALQWTHGFDCRVWSFANTVRTRKGGRHVEGALYALGTAMARVARHKKPWPTRRVLPGLTLVVAVDGPRSRINFAGPTKEMLSTDGLREGIVSVLTPVLERAIRERTDQRFPWVYF